MIWDKRYDDGLVCTYDQNKAKISVVNPWMILLENSNCCSMFILLLNVYFYLLKSKMEMKCFDFFDELERHVHVLLEGVACERADDWEGTKHVSKFQRHRQWHFLGKGVLSKL